ncbi:MAG: hypothetical protein KF802_04505 [Bdellovibrionaceae bacterium]|nr:hypothetical protein [Pseudobdellovibrionaceae bacterium]MBX3034188.1 hypothetical protein [Pseudobdellovibrionaceae bacterium]
MSGAFTCRMDIPEAPGLAPGELTVGREFLYGCTGPWPEWKEGAVLTLVLPPEQRFQARLLEAKRTSSDTYEMKLTGYAAQPVKIEKLIVTDGVSQADLGPLDFTVKSVLDPAKPEQEPYGPIGPMNLGIPLMWWAGGAVLLVALGLLVARLSYRRWQRRRLLEKIREHDAAVSPLAQLHQTLRRLHRESALFAGEDVSSAEAVRVVSELEEAFRIFLMRRFLLPAQEWRDALILKEFRKEHEELAELKGSELQRLMREFHAARHARHVEGRDALQLTKQTRQLAEVLDAKGGEV